MEFELLDTIVLKKDLPEHGLKQGDVGTVVELYQPDGLEIEFVTGSGKTQALLSMKNSDVRPIEDTEILTVRTFTCGLDV